MITKKQVCTLNKFTSELATTNLKDPFSIARMVHSTETFARMHATLNKHLPMRYALKLAHDKKSEVRLSLAFSDKRPEILGILVNDKDPSVSFIAKHYLGGIK